jgi:cysteine synthase B
MICSRKGYRLKVVMPDNVTPERTQLLKMYGAEIVYSPGDQGSNGAVAMALEMAAADASYYMPYQYGNEANPRAHYNGTALEILASSTARSTRSSPGWARAARSWATPAASRRSSATA